MDDPTKIGPADTWLSRELTRWNRSPVLRVDLYERERQEGTHRTYEVTARGTFPNGSMISAGASFSYAAWHEDGLVRLGKANARRDAIENALGDRTDEEAPR